MILGMSVAASVTLHTIISVVALLAGLVVAGGLAAARVVPGWTALFVVTTALTDITGFMLPADKILPSHITGVVSLVALLVAVVALQSGRLAGKWRPTYVVAALAAAWLNAFVLVAQLFVKVPPMRELAPTPAAPLFGITQLLVLGLFVVLGVAALRSPPPATA